MDSRLRMRHLRCFLETARLGSLSAAADAMRVSQPAASKTIRELETILQTSLFDRSRRRLQLTAAGKVFQEHCGTAMQTLQRAEDLVRVAPRARQSLSIGVLPTAATELIPLAALKFQAAFPEYMLRVATGPNWMLISQLREGSLDVVVGRMGPADAMEGLSFRHLFSDRVLPVVRPDHPLLKIEWQPDDLARMPLMLPPRGAVIAPLVRTYLHSVGLSHIEPAFENVSLAFGRRAVQESDLVWFISQGVVQSELNDGSLVALPLQDDLLGGPVGVSMRNQTEMTDALKGLLTTMKDVANSAEFDHARV